MSAYFRADRAVIIVNSLLAYAGVERRSLELAQYLSAKGIHVEVYVLREAGKIVPMFEGEGIRVRHIHVYDYSEEGHYAFHPLGFLRLVFCLFAGRFGRVFCVQPPSNLFARAACFPPLGRQVVAMERFLVRGRSPRRLLLDRWMAKWSRIVCVSTLLRDELAADARIAPDQISVIEDGVAIEPVFDLKIDLRAQVSGRFVFGCVGLLTERKRQRLLIEAMAELLKNFPLDGIRRPLLVLVGGGEDERKLRDLALSLNIEMDVIFVGEQIHPHDFYPLFNAFVFPSVGEGLGNVWAEAMQHGLPVICADVRPMSDYLRHEKNALLAAPDDATSLALQMKVLMTNPELRAGLSERGRIYAETHFQKEHQLQKLLELTDKGFLPGYLRRID